MFSLLLSVRAPGRPALSAATRRPVRAMASTVSYDLNFGPGSRLDSTVFGACRPGGAGEEESTAPGSIPDEAVSAWAAAVKEKGVSRVVSLLDATELAAYQTPLEQQYAKLFTRHDLVRMSHDPAESAAACARILEAFHSAHAAGEKVVVHCRGGQSRTGLALSSWLVVHHGLGAHEAAKEVMAQARAAKLVRFADEKKVAAFTGTT